jgi:hypothetical protein
MHVLWKWNEPATHDKARPFKAIEHPWSLAGNEEPVDPLQRAPLMYLCNCACEQSSSGHADHRARRGWTLGDNSTNEPNKPENRYTNTPLPPVQSEQTKPFPQPMVGCLGPAHEIQQNEATPQSDGWMDMTTSGQNEQNEATAGFVEKPHSSVQASGSLGGRQRLGSPHSLLRSPSLLSAINLKWGFSSKPPRLPKWPCHASCYPIGTVTDEPRDEERSPSPWRWQLARMFSEVEASFQGIPPNGDSCVRGCRRRGTKRTGPDRLMPARPRGLLGYRQSAGSAAIRVMDAAPVLFPRRDGRVRARPAGGRRGVRPGHRRPDGGRRSRRIRSGRVLPRPGRFRARVTPRPGERRPPGRPRRHRAPRGGRRGDRRDEPSDATRSGNAAGSSSAAG